jgi:hypothetical protein
MAVNLKRYIELQRILGQLELALTISREELAELESKALHDKIIYVRDEKGEWQVSELTTEEQTILLAMDEPTLVTITAEELEEIEKRSSLIRRDRNE